MKTLTKIAIVILLFTGCSKNSSYTNNSNVPDNLHNRPVGTSSGDLLGSSQYSSLKIEVQYMAGYQPDAAALTHLKNTLSGILNKPSGIEIITKEISVSSNLVLSVDEIISIEKQNRTAFTKGSDLAVYCLYTNGTYTDDNVLGIAYKNTSFVLFGKKIADNSGGIGQASRTKLVATVAEHEMGHLMGLVDLGADMQTSHKDQAHGNHCDNTNCLMYYASETSDILGFLVTGNIPVFDSNCRADLTANGGK